MKIHSGKIKTHFKLIIMDETEEWVGCPLKVASGKIYTAYLYDARRGVHLADIRPCYEMYPLYLVTEKHLSDGDNEELVNEFSKTQESIYHYCAGIDQYASSHEVVDQGEESHEVDIDEEADSAYYAIVEKSIEQAKCNPHNWMMKSTRKGPSL